MKTLFIYLISLSAVVRAAEPVEIKPEATQTTTSKLTETCVNLLDKVQGPFQKKNLEKACVAVKLVDGCTSVKGTPIVHFEKSGYDKSKKRILVFSLIHGDEAGAGSLVRYWMERLAEIEPRNDWRIVPVLNPDGFGAKTRVNANKVDLNRNFPTQDWSDQAEKYWKISTGSNPRRFPGQTAGGEPEVQCAMKHIQDFKPEFVVSIHTPLGVLDFDGPRVKPPTFGYLPWKSLGNFPGSLGRFLWAERQVPTLTTELKPTMPSTFDTFDKLQDVLGELAKYELKAPQATASVTAEGM